MSVTIKDWFPSAAQGIEALAQTPAVIALNQSLWLFSFIETLHLLSMAVLGGAVLVLNLRVLGAVLPDAVPQQVERAARPWLAAGIVGTIATGIVMMLATTVSSLTSTAFAVKMAALAAAITLSITCASQVRRGGASSRLALAAALLAGGLWLGALLLFAGTANLGAGALLVACVGFLLVGTLLPARRRVYLAGIAVILVAGLGGTFFLPASAAGDAWTIRLSLATMAIAAIWALAFGWLEKAASPPLSSASARQAAALHLSAFATILSWVTVAAAGRWIGFS